MEQGHDGNTPFGIWSGRLSLSLAEDGSRYPTEHRFKAKRLQNGRWMLRSYEDPEYLVICSGDSLLQMLFDDHVRINALEEAG